MKVNFKKSTILLLVLFISVGTIYADSVVTTDDAQNTTLKSTDKIKGDNLTDNSTLEEKGESINKQVDEIPTEPQIVEEDIPTAIEPTSSHSDYRVSETVSVRFQIPSENATDSTFYTFGYRIIGTQEWKQLKPYKNGNMLEYNLVLNRNDNYEYVLNYVKNKKYSKLMGTKLSVDDLNNIINETAEPNQTNTSFVEGDNEAYGLIKMIKEPNKYSYSASSFKIIDIDINDAMKVFKLYDTDGSLYPIQYGDYITFYSPSGSSLPNDRYYNYEIDYPGYEKATGSIYIPSGNSPMFEARNVVGHTTESNMFKLSITLYSLSTVTNIQFIDIDSNTQSTISTEKTTTSATFNSNILSVDLNGELEDIVTLDLVLAGHETISLKFRIQSNGTAELLNQDMVLNTTKNFTFDTNTHIINFRPIPVGMIEQDGKGNASVSFGELSNIFGQNVSVIPGRVEKGFVRIKNNSSRRYRVIDATINEPSMTMLNGSMLRVNSDAVQNYYSKFNPTYTMKKGSAAYLFDFEKINAIGLYDALLKVYQLDNPSLKSLEELPAKEVAKIFSNDYEFQLDDWEGDPNADYAYPLSTSQMAIRESDPKMIALAKHHLFNNSLYFTFDESITNSLFETSYENNPALQMKSYLAKNQETQDLLHTWFKSLGVLDKNSYLDLDAISYVLAGDLINDPYKPALSAFNFGFDFKLGIVGIDGYLFEDIDNNGIFSENEPVFANKTVTLKSNNLTVATTQTDADGYYEFPDVVSGNYSVNVELMPGYEVTLQSQDIEGNKFDAQGVITQLSVQDDQNYHLNAGFTKLLIYEANAEHVLLDSSGNIKEIIEKENQSGTKLEQYSFNEKSYDGYELVRVEGAPKSGYFADSDTLVKFIYAPKKVKLIVNYVDESGALIKDSEIQVVSFFDTYHINAIKIDGYTFKEFSRELDAFEGVIDKDQTNVTLIYTADENPTTPITPVKPVEPKLPSTGVTSNTVLIWSGLILVVGGIIIFAINTKRKKH